MLPNQITIIRITNGYIVSIPKHSKKFDYDNQMKEANECANKHYIPNYVNVSFFPTLEKLFEFLKSIEDNMAVENYAHSNGPILQ